MNARERLRQAWFLIGRDQDDCPKIVKELGLTDSVAVVEFLTEIGEQLFPSEFIERVEAHDRQTAARNAAEIARLKGI